MRVAASAALAVAVATGMTGCMLITPQQTSRSYTPSDGINAHVGDVAIRNAMLIVNSEGDAGTLVAAFVNEGDTARTLTLEYETSSGSTEEQRVQVPADGLVSLGAPVETSGDAASEPVVLDDIDAPLGALFRVVATSGSDDATLQLPILTGSLSEYATLVPTPTPTPTRTRRSTPAPSDSLSTEQPTDSPTPSETPSE